MTVEQTEKQGWETVLHSDDLQNCVDVWHEALTSGETTQVEHRLRRSSDGAYRWHSRQFLPVRDAENKIVKWFVTSTDIHERKKVEEELRNIRETLESRMNLKIIDRKQTSYAPASRTTSAKTNKPKSEAKSSLK